MTTLPAPPPVATSGQFAWQPQEGQVVYLAFSTLALQSLIGPASYEVRVHDPAAAKRDFARAFVEQVGGWSDVEEIWADFEPHVDLVVLVAELDLERELALRTVFLDLVRPLPDLRGSAELSVYAVHEDLPPRARTGERLF